MNYLGILLDTETNDLKVKDGHLQIGDTLYQNLAIITEAHQGEFKQFPTLGVGLDQYLGEEGTYNATLKHAIRENAKYDNVKITALQISETGEINIKAE
ncbi:MAG: hypothetical protein K5685_01415 [Bacteroidales bacterium]|nr:hypothetical protein [Bacteroidales bacterium]